MEAAFGRHARTQNVTLPERHYRLTGSSSKVKRIGSAR